MSSTKEQYLLYPQWTRTYRQRLPKEKPSINSVDQIAHLEGAFFKNVVIRMVDSKNTVQLDCMLDSGSAVGFIKSRLVDIQLVDCSLDSDKYSGINISNLIVKGKINV